MPDLWQTVVRFPVPALCCAILVVVANMPVGGFIGFFPDGWNNDTMPLTYRQFYGSLALGFLASGAAHLFAEGRRLSRAAGTVSAAACAFAVLVLFLSHKTFDMQWPFLLYGLVLAVMVAGYLHRGADDAALWMFNMRLAVATLAAIVAAAVFALGLAAIAGSLDYLFATAISRVVIQHSIATGVVLVGPIFGLSMVPRDLSERFQPDKPSGLLSTGPRLLLNALLIPLLSVYVVILHVYAARILFDWDLPRGQIGIIVLIFALGGAAVWLIGLPWRERGSVLVRLFERVWFWCLIVPLVLLTIGTWRRVSEYGVTPERYGLIVLGFWIAFLIVWRTVGAQSLLPRVVLSSLSAVLILSSFGPWGAGAVSVTSQHARLMALLQDRGIVRDGRLIVSEGGDGESAVAAVSLKETDSDEVWAIARFLGAADRLDTLAPLFEEVENDPFVGTGGRLDAHDVVTAMGIPEPVWQARGNPNALDYRADGPTTLDIDGPVIFSGPHEFGEAVDGARDSNPRIALDGQSVVVRHGADEWRIGTRELLAKLREQLPLDDNALPRRSDAAAVIAIPGTGGEARLVVNHLAGRLDADDAVIEQAEADLILPQKRW